MHKNFFLKSDARICRRRKLDYFSLYETAKTNKNEKQKVLNELTAELEKSQENIKKLEQESNKLANVIKKVLKTNAKVGGGMVGSSRDCL